jgi:hypothetical protein
LAIKIDLEEAEELRNSSIADITTVVGSNRVFRLTGTN